MISKQDFSDALRHPFVMLLATALISQLLIARITQGWQDHQRQNEVKAQLVTQSGQAVGSMLVAAQFDEFGGAAQSQEEINRAFKEWEIGQVVLSTRIRAYFADPDLATSWDAFARMITYTYASGARAQGFRKEHLVELREYLRAGGVNWSALETGYSDKAKFGEYNLAWFQLKEALLQRYGRVTQRILDANVR
jgi:hypothetical protein